MQSLAVRYCLFGGFVWFPLVLCCCFHCAGSDNSVAVQLGGHNNAVKVHLLPCLICMFCSVQPRVSRESGPWLIAVCLDCSFFLFVFPSHSLMVINHSKMKNNPSILSNLAFRCFDFYRSEMLWTASPEFLRLMPFPGYEKNMSQRRV